MILNSNYPVLEHAWGPRWDVGGAAIPAEGYVDVSPRTRDFSPTASTRGRQYELDQVRAGNVTTVWANPDGALDPTNTTGPWYGHVTLFSPYRLRAQYPPSRNLLAPVQATGGDDGGYPIGPIPADALIHTGTDVLGGLIVTSATADQGGRVFQFTVPNSTASGTPVCYTAQPAVAPGLPYAVQARVRNITGATSLSARAYIAWYDASGALISTSTGTSATLTGSSTAAWTTLTVTGTAPATTASWELGVRTAATSPGSTLAVQVDTWQAEQAAATTAWTAPGTWYPMFAGFVERLPPSWELSGTYGVTTPAIYDALALLSQCTLRDPLTEEIKSRGPRFVFTLADPQGSSHVTDTGGNLPAATVAVSKYGPGALTLGTVITATDPVNGIYTGSSGTVARLANASPGTATPDAATYIDLTPAGIYGPAGATWSRAIAFRYTGPLPTSGDGATIWAGFGYTYTSIPPGGGQISATIRSTGFLEVTILDNSSAGGTVTVSTNVADGNWHLLAFGITAAGQRFTSLDGSYATTASSTGPVTLLNDNLGAWVDPSTGNTTPYNFAGDLAFACEWPVYLAAADCTALYTAWRTAFAGDSSDERYQRILDWAGYSGDVSLQSGLTTSMGPATDVTGRDALSALLSVVTTENGNHYVSRSGTITFKARSDRYNALTPAYVFGENTAGGEYPYTDIRPDYDPTRLANQIAVTQASTSQMFTAQDDASIKAYFPRPLARTINTSSTAECQDAATYLLSRYRQPALRIASLVLDPSAYPALWPVCLSLELDTRIRVMRRPIGAPAMAIDCFVESLAWRIDPATNRTVLTVQCSPVDLTPYAVFAAFHTTLATTIPAAGVSTITINAGADNTNQARAQLTGGQQLILGLGTANEETVTIAAGGVAATTAGWTTCVLTLAAPVAKTHTAGVTVCEPLPSGITSATTYDGSVFDQRVFAY